MNSPFSPSASSANALFDNSNSSESLSEGSLDTSSLYDEVVLAVEDRENFDLATHPALREFALAHTATLSWEESELAELEVMERTTREPASKPAAKRSRKASVEAEDKAEIGVEESVGVKRVRSRAAKSPVEGAPQLDEPQFKMLPKPPVARAVELRGEAVEEDSLKLWWKRVHTYPLLTAAREIELAKRIEQGDESAAEEMIECNLRLVASIARKCKKSAGPLSLADLVQEGSVGLIRAVQKFDYRKGYKFSTYASYWIRQAILRSIDEQSRAIRLPVYMLESASRAERARVALTQELHRPPTDRELARHLQLSTNKVQELSERVPEPVSLDACVGEDDDSTLSDFIEDRNAPSPVDCALRAVLREELIRAFECLSEREVEVLSLRYGMDEGGHARTLDEVGALLNLTRERIRQIEKMALKRLKRSSALRETARDYQGNEWSGIDPSH